MLCDKLTNKVQPACLSIIKKGISKIHEYKRSSNIFCPKMKKFTPSRAIQDVFVSLIITDLDKCGIT